MLGKKESRKPDRRDDKARQLRVRSVGRGLAAAGVVAAIIAAYAFYVWGRADYFVARDLRILLTLRSQLDATIEAQRTIIRSLAKNKSDLDDLTPRKYLGRFRDLRASTRPLRRDKTPVAAKEEIRITRQQDISGSVLDVAYTAVDPAASEEISVKGVVDFDDIVRPIFSQSFAAVFDSVLLADKTGRVLQQISPSDEPGPAHPLRARDASSGAIINSLSSLQQADGTQLNVGSLEGVSQRIEVKLNGMKYYLFTQPYQFTTLRCSGCPEGDVERREEWLICAVIPAGVFRADILAISGLWLALGVGGILIAICFWTFWRVTSLGETRPLRPSDVVLAGLGVLVGGAVMTIIAADVFVYRRLRAVEDQQLLDYGRGIGVDLTTDVERATKFAYGLASLPDVRNLRLGLLDNLGRDMAWKSNDGWQYPYFTSIAWVDIDGNEVVKGSATSGKLPRLSVGSRPYFRTAKQGNFQFTKERRPYTLGFERSLATGEQETVIAIPSEVPGQSFRFFTVTLPLIHVKDPVVPAGYGFAVIDESGRVFLHSDRTRNVNENFFKETDDDRDIRAAVFARQEATVGARYWGVDHRVFVTPVPGMPRLTVVAFRDGELLSNINSEALATTALLLALYASFYALIFLIVAVAAAILKHRPRQPWLWPHFEELDRYAHLIIALTIEAAAMVFSIYLLFPSALLVIGFAAPFRAICTAGIILNSGRRRKSLWLLIALSALTTFLWSYAASNGEVDVRLDLIGDEGRAMAALQGLILLGFASGVVGLLIRCKRRDADVTGVSRAYVLTGAIVVALVAVLPAVAFFKAATRFQVETRVKYAQYTLAGELQRRLDYIEQMNQRPVRIAYDTYSLKHLFGSQWCLQPRIEYERSETPPANLTAPLAKERIVRPVHCFGSHHKQPWIPDVLDEMLPHFSEASVTMRELRHDVATDGSWSWCRSPDGDIILHRDVSLDAHTMQRFYRDPPRKTTIAISSTLPFLLPEFRISKEAGLTRSFERRALWRAFRILVVYLIPACITLSVLFLAIRFIARRVFLIDLHEPLWLPRSEPIEGPVGANLFVCRRNAPVDGVVKRSTFHEISIALIDGKSRTWEGEVFDVEMAPPNRDVLIFDFDDRLNDAETNHQKLVLIDRLLELPGREVVLVARVSPAYVTAHAALRPEDEKRWAQRLSSFIWVGEQWRASSSAGWLDMEIANEPFLATMQEPLTSIRRQKMRLIDEISERVGSYYGRIWSACTLDEKLMLYHLARFGFLNGRNRRVARRLFARGLIVRRPDVRIYSEPFEAYVLEAGQREHIAARERAAQPTTGEQWRIPAATVLVALTALLLVTQHELVNSASVIITALVTAIPLLTKLISALSGEADETAAEA